MSKKTENESTELKILVLEDSLRDLELMREQLSTAGYRLDVTHVENEADFTAPLREKSFDLILADFKLPGFDAFGALEISRELCPETPFICVSGTIGEETAVELLKRGAVDYVLKDRPGRLPMAVKRALEKAEVKAEYKKAAEALQKSEEKFKNLFQHHKAVKIIIDSENGSIVEANQAAAEFYGWSVEELQQMNIAQINLLTPREIKKEIEKARNLKKTHFEFRHRKADGSIIDVEVFSSNIVIEGKDYLHSIVHDITEKKQAEQELIEQKDLLTAIYRNAPLVMMVVNAERRIQQVNGFATQFANRNAEDMLDLRGGEALRCMHILDDPEGCGFGDFCQQCVIRNTVLDTIETRKTHLQKEAPYFYQGEDKKIRKMTLLASTTPIMVKGERMVLVTLQDITKRESLEAQLRQAQKMEAVGKLAGGVAHDFNNMLNVIIGYSQMVMNSLSHDAKEYKNIEEILKAANRSADLTRQLLAFARRQTIAPKIIDLNETVEGLLKMLRRLIGENIDLAWQPGKKLVPVKVDPSQIHQLLANLCVNARDAIGGVGRLTIETDRVGFDEGYCADHPGFIPGEFIMLAVSDDGCGMDKETLDNIFEPFFTTKGVGEGTGLGLATVHGIVKQNDGFINVYSEPGKGTTFKVYLPSHAEESVETKSQETTEMPAARGETVLVVEDEVSILELVQIVLENLGYTVLAVSTPCNAEALAKEHAGDINLLITDVVMPEINGKDLAEKLKIRYPDLKVLFMSGYTTNVIAHQGVLDSGVNFIQKPFTNRGLALKVREALNRD